MGKHTNISQNKMEGNLQIYKKSSAHQKKGSIHKFIGGVKRLIKNINRKLFNHSLERWSSYSPETGIVSRSFFNPTNGKGRDTKFKMGTESDTHTIATEQDNSKKSVGRRVDGKTRIQGRNTGALLRMRPRRNTGALSMRPHNKHGKTILETSL